MVGNGGENKRRSVGKGQGRKRVGEKEKTGLEDVKQRLKM